MICQKERKILLIAKKRYAAGDISQDALYTAAEVYRNALIQERKNGVRVGGKPLWVPQSLHRIVCITCPFPGEIVE